MATLEEASKCPKCREPGRHYKTERSGNPGNQVLMYRCENSQCSWGADPEDLGWIVEVDRNGAIVERDPGDRQFPKLILPTNEAEARAKRIAESYSRPVENLDETPEVSGP